MRGFFCEKGEIDERLQIFKNEIRVHRIVTFVLCGGWIECCMHKSFSLFFRLAMITLEMAMVIMLPMKIHVKEEKGESNERERMMAERR